MNLLYCDADGVVVAWHDSALNVPASNYVNVVRVIPYDQPVRTLDRIGPAPSNPADARQDTRPYAQPTETPEILAAYAAQVRFDVATAGFSFAARSGTVPVKCDRVSQMLVGNLAAYSSTAAAESTNQIDFIQDGTPYVITASEVSEIFNQMQDLIQQARAIEAQCLTDLASAGPTILTYADVDARFAGVIAKTLKRKV